MNNKYILILLLLLAFSCKKQESTAVLNENLEKYAKKGYHYLFTINPNDSENILPIFIGRDELNQIKYIISRQRGAVNSFESKVIINNESVSWPLIGIDFNQLINYHWFELDPNGELNIDFHGNLTYSEKRKIFTNYNSRDSQVLFNQFNDTLNIKYNSSFYYTMPNLKETYITQFKSEHQSILEHFAYRANVFDMKNQSILAFFAPENSASGSFNSIFYSYVRDQAGIQLKHQFQSNQLTTISGKDYPHQSGLFMRFFEKEKDDFGFVFYSDNRLINHQPIKFKYLNSSKESKLIEVNSSEGYSDKSNVNAIIKYFYYKGSLYISTNDINYLNDGFQVMKVNGSTLTPIKLNLHNILGIFGSKQGILVAVKNDKKGIDILSLIQ